MKFEKARFNAFLKTIQKIYLCKKIAFLNYKVTK